MSDFIDKRIAELENELSSLRRQKLVFLQSEVAALQASLAGSSAPGAAVKSAGASSAGGPRRKGRPGKTAGKGWDASGQSDTSTASPRRRRGRRRGKQISDEEALAMLRNVVAASGSAGIPASHASDSAGVSYPRAIKLMDSNFKKTGAGKWTRYSLK